jgi:hypothetical protein
MKIEQHSPKGMRNTQPSSLKSEAVLFMAMVYDTIKKEIQVIAINNILSYISSYMTYYPFIIYYDN